MKELYLEGFNLDTNCQSGPRTLTEERSSGDAEVGQLGVPAPCRGRVGSEIPALIGWVTPSGESPLSWSAPDPACYGNRGPQT